MNIQSNPSVKTKFKSYPKHVSEKLANLRQLIIDTAKATGSVTELEETLKWGEPSYIAPKGSTIRIEWKAKSPDQYAIYFKCTSKLVLTFKEVYGGLFNYEKNRAILFTFDDKVPKKELGECIKSALLYHTLKNQERLGMSLESGN
jgi:hypothetical protein